MLRAIGGLRAVAFFFEVADEFDIFQTQPDGLAQHAVRCAATIKIDGHKPHQQGEICAGVITAIARADRCGGFVGELPLR